MKPATFLALLAAVTLSADDPPKPYTSPYKVEFTHKLDDLIGDLQGGRGDFKGHSSVAFDQWGSPETRKKWGAWGPGLKKLDPPAGLDAKTAVWQRERIIAAAMRHVGVSYQHHHIPDWEPPADWPWKDVSRGHNGKGVDCSNFTTYVYTIALGAHFSSAIGPQSEAKYAKAGGKELPLKRIEKPESYADCKKLLRTGDLLFIKNTQGNVSHVVLWVGDVGKAKDGVPLILDSTGPSHKDEEGASIPDGVQLRPFREGGWYFKSLSHALRLVPDDE